MSGDENKTNGNEDSIEITQDWNVSSVIYEWQKKAIEDRSIQLKRKNGKSHFYQNTESEGENGQGTQTDSDSNL